MKTAPIGVLLVEDNPDDVLLIQRNLRSLGEPVEAEHVNAPAALREALRARTWDVVLCDYSVPGLDFTTVLSLVGEESGGTTPVVLVTGTVGEEAVADLMRSGVADVVLKDRLRSRLAAVVQREVAQARQRRAMAAQRQRGLTVLGFFSGAAHWREAMEASLGYLAASYSASAASISELIGDPLMFVPVTSWSVSELAEFGARLRGHPPIAGSNLLRETLQTGSALAVRRLTDRVADGSPLVAEAAACGLTALITQLLEAGGRRFAVTFYFADDNDAIEQITSELGEISAVLQPVLYRKFSEDERTLLANALEAARSGVIITEGAPLDPPGPRIVYANQAIFEMTGFSRGELLGQTPRVLQGAGTDRAELARLRGALESAKPVKIELLNYSRDGTPYWVELHITPVREGRRITHFIAIETNVTERRKAEQERRRREASFRLMFHDNPMPMWVYDIETLRFLEVNGAAIAQYGWSRDEFLARTVPDVRLVEDEAAFRVSVKEAHLSNRVIAAIHVTASGERIAVRTAVSGIEYDGHAANLAVNWDVTEVERARNELRLNNEKLAAMTQNLASRTAALADAARLAGIGYWSMDLHPRRIAWSPEIYAILGRDPATFHLDWQAALDCVHPDDLAGLRNGYHQMLHEGVDRQHEYRVMRPSGEVRLLRELGRPKRDADGRVVGITGVIQDITAQKSAEDALLRAEKLKTLGQITGGIAHDFNNLLTVIGVNIEMVLESDTLAEELREFLQPALHASLRGGELTGQLLSYARRQSLRPRPADLQALVETLQPLLTRAVGARHVLRLLPRSTDLRVLVDAGQFENALMNLVINARDALSPGGEIVVTVAAARFGEPQLAVPDTIPAGQYVRVRVADNGHGILPEILPKIFEPFFTTKAVGVGSGLGLSMVYGFVHQSQGCMAVASVPREGTAVDLYFPVSDAADDAALPLADKPPVVPAGRQSVLIVEDQDDLRQSIHRTFEQLGYETVSVATAEEATEVLASPARLTLLFSDIVLRGKRDGLALATAAAAMRPDLNIVLTSGDMREVNPNRLRWPVLPKPFRLSALMAVL